MPGSGKPQTYPLLHPRAITMLNVVLNNHLLFPSPTNSKCLLSTYYVHRHYSRTPSPKVMHLIFTNAFHLYITKQYIICSVQHFCFLLEYNCFIMLCYFLLYNNINQLYVYIYPLALGPPSHFLLIPPQMSSQCYTAAFTSYLFYTWSVLAQRITWREEPGGLQSTGSQRVRHN